MGRKSKRKASKGKAENVGEIDQHTPKTAVAEEGPGPAQSMLKDEIMMKKTNASSSNAKEEAAAAMEIETTVACLLSSVVDAAIMAAATAEAKKQAAAALVAANEAAGIAAEMAQRAIEEEVRVMVSTAIEDAVVSAAVVVQGKGKSPSEVGAHQNAEALGAAMEAEIFALVSAAIEDGVHAAAATYAGVRSQQSEVTTGPTPVPEKEESREKSEASPRVTPIVKAEILSEPHVKHGRQWTEVTWRGRGRLGLRLQQREGPERGVVLVGFDDEELSIHLEIGSVLAQVLRALIRSLISLDITQPMSRVAIRSGTNRWRTQSSRRSLNASSRGI